MSTPTLETLQQQLSDALERISTLERDIQRIRQNTNSALQGNASMIETLVAHTGCQPARGQYFIFGTQFDVGHS
jgi:predicted RNase H-like nuclease (RuvC/YqgF family)